MKKIILLFLLLPFPLLSESRLVIINEIAWMGTQNSANDEWIELRNLSSDVINLDGWKIESIDGQPSIALSGAIAPESYFLLERSNDDSVSGVTADQIYTGSLSNSGEILHLKDEQGNIVDGIMASSTWPAGDNLSKQTMARESDLSWASSIESGGTPGLENNFSDNNEAGNNAEIDHEQDDVLELDDEEKNMEQEEVEETEEKTENKGVEIRFEYGDVMINEIVSDPEDEENEWIELVLCANRDINLNGWVIEEGSKSKTKLQGSLKESKRYIVFEKLSGNLNNKGDEIVLRDSGGRLIDKLIYGSWNGSSKNNAEAISDPGSLARVHECEIDLNYSNSFAASLKKTYATRNEFAAKKELDKNTKSKLDLIITELLPNPSGVDKDLEWIEVYNPNDTDVALDQWSLMDKSGRQFWLFSDECSVLPAHELMVIFRPESHLSLNNKNEEVYLYNGTQIQQKIEYEIAPSDESFVCVFKKGKHEQNELLTNKPDDCIWQWSKEHSPGQENPQIIANNQPEADFDCPEESRIGQAILFDSSDTSDPENDKLEYFWSFGDSSTNTLPFPEHTFFATGTFVVRLEVNDQFGSSSVEKLIKIVDSEAEQIASSSGHIIISEFLPNPEGSDADGEFIELYNAGGTAVNLLSWQVDDGEKGSKPFLFQDDFILSAGQFFILDREESGLALNNTIDSVRLFDPSGHLVEEVVYQKPLKDNSYSRFGQEWKWSSVSTPKEKNVIKVINTNNTSPKRSNQVFREVALEDVQGLDSGESVRTEGLVAVLPGVLGSQYFYISGLGGAQVYSYKKSFPKLSLGDKVSVQGEISSIQGEKRIKIKTSNDVTVINENNEEPSPDKLSCDKLDEEKVGSLVKLEGVVTERKGATVFLDDGSSEAKIYLKASTGIDSKIFEEGEKYEVSGILSRANSGLRLLPRDEEDVLIKTKDDEQSGKVLGSTEVLGDLAIPQKAKPPVVSYVLAIMIVINFALVAYIFIIKSKKE